MTRSGLQVFSIPLKLLACRTYKDCGKFRKKFAANPFYAAMLHNMDLICLWKPLHLLKKIAMRNPILFMLLLLPSIGLSQNFSRFIETTSLLPQAKRHLAIDSFLKAQQAFPIIEQDSVVHFVYTGKAMSVSLAGDVTDWKPGVMNFSNIPNTHFWYRTDTYHPASRIDYKLVVDGSIWMADPRNPNACAGGYGSNSELRMPKFRYPTESAECQGKSCGIQIDTLIQSTFMGQARRFVVLLPPNYKTTTQRYPTIYIHDGQDFLHYGQAQHILANVMAEGSMQEVIAVFVYPVERDAEYSGKLQERFTNFMVSELVPWVDTNFRTLPQPHNRLVMGISNGGNISLWQAVMYPEVFGCVAAQSSNVEENILKAFKKKKLLPLRIYTDIGLYDLSVLKPKVEALNRLLVNKGFDYKHVVLPDGHSWCNWRSHWKEIFGHFFAPK